MSAWIKFRALHAHASLLAAHLASDDYAAAIGMERDQDRQMFILRDHCAVLMRDMLACFPELKVTHDPNGQAVVRREDGTPAVIDEWGDEIG